MKAYWIIPVLLSVLAIVVFVMTLLETRSNKEACEPFRFTAIQDVPARCFEYFQKDFR